MPHHLISMPRYQHRIAPTAPPMRFLSRWRFADPARLALYLHALWKLFHHPQTPRAARWIAMAVVAYAVSPIDLIPDFIPVLGQLDDLILLPLGIALVLKLTPDAVWQDCLQQARRDAGQRPRLIGGAVVIVLLWLIVLAALGWWLWRTWGAPAV
jgi:uncharacterized membrane protein YkvA (DUF1232 family)